MRRAAPDAQVALTLNLAWVRPASGSAADADAARRIDGLQDRVFLDPTMRGTCPVDVLADTASVTDWGFVRDGDLELVCQPLDALGLNDYSPTVVRAYDGSGPRVEADGHGYGAASAWPACEDVEFPPQPGPRTDTGWSVDARGMTELLLRLAREHPGVDLSVTENGAAYPDVVPEDGAVHDVDRIAYLHAHLSAVAAAVEAGIAGGHRVTDRAGHVVEVPRHGRGDPTGREDPPADGSGLSVEALRWRRPPPGQGAGKRRRPRSRPAGSARLAA